MNETHSPAERIRQFLIILGPIIITQVALSAMNVVDTMMSGRYGAEDLAGVAIGSNLWLPVATGFSGILTAVTPIVAQLIGARRDNAVPGILLQGIYLALALAAGVLIVGALTIGPLLTAMELESEVRRIAHQYLVGLLWGLAPLFVYTVLRSFIDALGQTGATMAITLTSLPINVLFNYALIYGKFGFPELGGVGAGYASAITYWLILLLAIVVISRRQPFVQYPVFARLAKIEFATWGEQLRIGLPIGLSILLEVGIFSSVAILMSRFGTATLAAHQAAINFATFLYMIPLSIAMALTIVVGFEVGARRINDAVEYRRLGLSASITMACVCAAVLYFFGDAIARLYTADPEVLTLVHTFVAYVIFFQFSDALAAPIQGTLRGYKDVTVTLVLSLFSYWMVGLPLGHVLSTLPALGPKGYWVGLITGLAVGALGLSIRLRYVERMHRQSPHVHPAEVTSR